MFAIGIGIAMLRCSLTTSLDGLSGGVDPVEAGSGGPEAGSDATTNGDAASAPDSSTDAGTDGGRFCASLAQASSFCDDFDDEGPFAGWTETRVGGGGTVTRDRGAFRSAPNSLLAMTPASASGSAAALSLASPTTIHRVVFAFDMRIDARDPQTGYAEVSYIRFGDPSSPPYALYMRVFNDPAIRTVVTTEAYLSDGGVPQHNVALAGDPKFTDWARVVVDLDLRSAPHLTVTVDGAVAADAALESAFYPPAVARVEPGIGYVGSPTSGAWKLRFDNVTVDWLP